MSDWHQYVVFEDSVNGIRLIEEHGPHGVWGRKAEPGYTCFPQTIQAFERTMRRGRRRATLRLLDWKKAQRTT
jgi:hypothetical protein